MGGGWVVVVVVVATNFSVSSWQGFKALRPFALRAIPCRSLPDPCLSFTIFFGQSCQLLVMKLRYKMNFFTGTDDGFTFVNSVFDTDNFRDFERH